MSSICLAHSAQKIDLIEFGKEVVQASFEVGSIHSSMLSTNSLMDTQSIHINTICDLFMRLNCESQNMSLLVKMAHKVDGEAKPVLTHQVTLLANQISNCRDMAAYPLFDKIVTCQLAETSQYVKKVQGELNLYRETRSVKNREEASKALEMLKVRHQLTFSLAERCNMDFTSPQLIEINKLNALIMRISNQIEASCQSEKVYILHILDDLNNNTPPNGANQIEKLQSRLKERVNKLSDELQNSLDNWICKLAFGKKEDPDWAKTHRYDNLSRLRTAYLCALQESIEASFSKTLYPQLLSDRTKFYELMHEFALGPQNADPIDWAKKELPYLCDLIPEVIEELDYRTLPLQLTTNMELEFENRSSTPQKPDLDCNTQ